MDPHRKNRRTKDRDYTFHESLAPTIPLAPSADITRRLPVGYLLAALWVIAAVAFGVGLGLLLVKADRPAAPDPPYPVTTASLNVAPLATAAQIARGSAVVQPALATAKAYAVTQAQAGTPLKVASVTYLQPASSSAPFQPGYNQYTQSIQGTLGTAAVAK
jgi:hypothetical protein